MKPAENIDLVQAWGPARRLKAAILGIALAAGCAAPSPPRMAVDPEIARELKEVAVQKPPVPDAAKVQDALLPPLRAELPGSQAAVLDPRFDLSVSNAPAAQVFMSIVSGTRFSMLVHPEVTGTMSINLKDVTVAEAMHAIRETYGYEYRIDGTRIFVQPAGIQTRVFRVNYLIGQRLGRTDVRVTSGSVADGLVTAPGAAAQPVPPPQPVAQSSTGGTVRQPNRAPTGRITDSSRVQTNTETDFWTSLEDTLRLLVGEERGRNVVVNPQAGLVVVRAMPEELRAVETYLNAIRSAVERQVMLEAKIIEVTLNEQFQTGINWALFSSSGRTSAGLVNPNTVLGTGGTISSGANSGTDGLRINPSPGSASVAAGTALGQMIQGLPGGSLLGIAFQTQNFVALLQFLESQGSVQVLSSPRIATLNNQKAVLKVGTDEFFVTNVAGGSATTPGTTGGTTTFPTLTLQPFFSGVALDITPQIDEDGKIILHVHPQVSRVQRTDRVLNLGTVFGGNISLPLAQSTVSETDSVVKLEPGNIVAIGGLMKVDVANDRSGLPGAQDSPTFGPLFGTRQRTSQKKELVILIKPTVIQDGRELVDDARASGERINTIGGGRGAPGVR